MESADSKSLVLLFPANGSENKYLQLVKIWLFDDPTLQVHEATSVADVGTQIAQFNQGLLIFSICDKTDLVEVVNCLATHQNLVKNRFLRVVGVSNMEHPEVIKLLMKRGVADILPTNLTAKALKHKIAQSFKILERYHANAAVEAQREAANSQEKKSQTAANTRNKPTVKKTPALTLASDCWLVRKERDVRQVQGRWLIDLLGAGPSIASWEESTSPQAGITEWVWTMRQPNTDFVTEEGNWVFKGRKPEFVWTESRWRFVGESAELYFARKGQPNVYRVQCLSSQNVLEVSENSEQAKAKLQAMIRSIEAEVRFKNEKNKPSLSKQFALGEDTPEAGEVTQEELDGISLVEAEPETSLSLQMWLSGNPQGLSPIAVSPIEMSPTEIVAEVSAGLFSRTQKVCLILDDGLKKANSRTQFQAVVIAQEASDADHDLVHVQLADGKMLPIENSADAIRARQEEITNFLKAARGW